MPPAPVRPRILRETNLTPGGRQEVLPAHHERHPLHHVVDGGDALIGPVAKAIAKKKVAALRRGILHASADDRIVERFFSRLNHQPPSHAVFEGDALVTARSRIAEFGARLTCAGVRRIL